MSENRDKKFHELRQLIEAMDAGTIQIHVYKGMPVKARLVGGEMVLGGNDILNLNETETFSPRKWWKENET